MTHTPILSLTDRARLVAILGRLGSDHDGERAAAGLLATRMLVKLGLGWNGVVIQPVTPSRAQVRQPGCAQGWRSDIALCTRHIGRLSRWEAEFTLSLSGRRRTLTPTQAAKLAEIAAELRKAGCT